MSDEARRKILEAVAAGRMDPSDAADALADLDVAAEPPSPPPPTPETAERRVERQVIVHEQPGPSHSRSDREPSSIRLIKVDANFRPVEVIGDPSVREAVAEGNHRVRWESDVLVIDGAALLDDEDDDYDHDDGADIGEWFRTRGPRHVRFAYSNRGEYRPRPLRVRVNPDLPLEARVEAGPLKIIRVHGPIKARVAAGPLLIEDFESPIDVRVAAGKVDATGRIDHGASTIDCDAGKVRLHLRRGSDARVSASATLGKVDFGGRRTNRRREAFEDIGWTGIRNDLHDLSGLGERISSVLNNAFSDEHEAVVGKGTATIDIRVSMGAADITFEDKE